MSNKTIISYDELHIHIKKLYKDISLEFCPDRILGLSRGGLLPGIILSHMFNKPFNAVHWATRDFTDEYNDNLSWVSAKIKEKEKILLVDDICDTGKTLDQITKAIEFITCEHIPRDVFRFASVYKRYNTPFILDYYSLTITNDNWVVFPYEQY